MDDRPPKPASPESDPPEEKVERVTDQRPSQSPSEEGEAEATEDAPLPDEGAPPLPDEPPPLPNEAPPGEPVDDGWAPVWDDGAQAFYFYNRFTQLSQWNNPRVPDAAQAGPPGVANHDRGSTTSPAPTAGYNPAIHGDYDPNADYAKPRQSSAQAQEGAAPGTTPADPYAATGAFNRFTGKWQAADYTPERFSDEAKSKRQMNAFFDVDAAANSHDGRSLRAERQQKKLSKKELKEFKEKRREKKEEKRRAWLKD